MAEGLKIVNDLHARVTGRLIEQSETAPRPFRTQVDGGVVFLSIAMAFMILDDDPALAARVVEYLKES